jgi:5-oxoprolinase (ATP-hydrolysing) subunit C
VTGRAATRAAEILEGGIQSTVQDYPGRQGMLAQGFFPAGPMDHFALRAANLLAGNDLAAAALEVTLGGLAMRVDADATLAVCGAEAELSLGGEPASLWESHRVPEGTEIRLGVSQGPGFRMYVAVSGAIAVEPVLGSRATYTMGALGGFEGRALSSGDVLPLGDESANAERAAGRRFKASERPEYGREWEIEAIRGPHADPDFLTAADMELLFSRPWAVDRNSNRTGIRLESHRFQWARSTGGIAGGHPSNILDNSYAVGSVNINGDLPVILGPDGPTAGGFICAAAVAHAGFWKVGQLRPVGDSIRFREVTVEEAAELDRELEQRLAETSLESI